MPPTEAEVLAGLPPERQPITSCPTCGALLCDHLVCRVCGDCHWCDGKERQKGGKAR